MNWFPKYNFILASKSPRRQHLLKSLEIDFQVIVKEVKEDFPADLPKEEIPVYLALLKAQPFRNQLKPDDLLITADTIVWHRGKVLGKPSGENEAKKMLSELSGSEHEVISGVCLTSVDKQKTFYSVSNVQFKKLSNDEIDYYISSFKPFDKAGAYGIQEWIGCIGIKHIEGSFYNIMGLPVQKLYEEILQF
ncbi:septum formation protein [Tangfeifania diversioriginum]|uniref:dTTP/UTP pyrophosphatase n=1 Tax=Tangfeifania diversioriginum TaxID=1168035 RepID=A0A1M6L8L4_9BACT|nr:Maf-like protein [Tangfeifania diversioriginum]SHJ67588.1 septum formation protein [Tangfeifania diversioriginum]